MVVAFGRIIKPHVLAALPMVNLHFSLLPRWRGAAPVERAILAGDTRTGVDLMDVEEGLDTGGIYREAVVDDRPRRDRRRAPRPPRRARAPTCWSTPSPRASASPGRRRASRSTPTSSPPTTSGSTGRRRRPTIHGQVRVGGAWTTHNGKRLKVWRTALAPTTARLELLEVQPEGKPRMAVRDWANGARWSPGDPLGT